MNKKWIVLMMTGLIVSAVVAIPIKFSAEIDYGKGHAGFRFKKGGLLGKDILSKK